MKTSSAKRVWLEAHGHWAHLHHRSQMSKRAGLKKAALPHAAITIPTVTLPVDCSGNRSVSCPMLGNNQYGDCGPVMCAHLNEMRTFGQGKQGWQECSVNQDALVAQYEKVSGGDNGTDEDMLVGAQGIWTAAGGGIAGDPTQIVVDSLDIDVTNVPLANYCIDQFDGICMAWSVPDAFLSGFSTGTVWTGPGIPDENNGHYSLLADIDASGKKAVWTWGSFAWMDDAYIASVQPQCFVTMSPLQFNAQGYDSKGRHVSDVAAAWIAIGGDEGKMAAFVGTFPPKAQPVPPPPAPTPPTAPPTFAEAKAAYDAKIAAQLPLMSQATASSVFDTLQPLWPTS